MNTRLSFGLAEEEDGVAALAVAHEEVVARVNRLHQPVDGHVQLHRDGRRLVVEVRDHRAQNGQGQQGRSWRADGNQLRQRPEWRVLTFVVLLEKKYACDI